MSAPLSARTTSRPRTQPRPSTAQSGVTHRLTVVETSDEPAEIEADELPEGWVIVPAKPQVENPEYMKACVRFLRAAARRVSSGDVEALPLMVDLHRELDELIGETIKALNEDCGYSYAEIAARLGTSRQNVHKRARR